MTKQKQEAIGHLRTAKEWLALAEEAKKQGMVYLLLTGGEPFLRPDFREILSGLNKIGLLISINSNGTLIAEDVIAWLKEAGIVVKLNCSVTPHNVGDLDDIFAFAKREGLLV